MVHVLITVATGFLLASSRCAQRSSVGVEGRREEGERRGGRKRGRREEGGREEEKERRREKGGTRGGERGAQPLPRQH